MSVYMNITILSLILCGYAKSSYFRDNTSDETPCQCLPPHLCADNDKAATGHGLLDIRFENDACPNYYDVCCETPHQQTEKTTKMCGIPKTIAMGPRITSNSEVSQFGELPWTVLIFEGERSKDRNPFICGGALIHPKVVITASHCLDNRKKAVIKVRAGEWNVKNNEEPIPHQDKIVTEILVHTMYRPGILWHDIAMLFLNEPYVINDNIGFICLPSRELQLSNDNLCLASGWGKNAFSRGRHSSVLRKVTLPIVPKNKCQSSLRNTRLGKYFKLHRSFICAGGEKNRDTCKGDGGSPLICPNENGRYIQIGIVSWGIGCGANKTPGVYVNVPLYTEWIDKQMQIRNLSTEYYKL